MFSPWVAQLVEQATDNRWVIGSNPVPRTKFVPVVYQVRTSDFQSEKPGSIPGGDAKCAGVVFNGQHISLPTIRSRFDFGHPLQFCICSSVGQSIGLKRRGSLVRLQLDAPIELMKIFSSNVKKVVYKLFALCYNYSIKTNKATLMNKDTEAFDMETITSQWYWRSVRQANRQVKPRCEVVSIKTAADTVTAKNNVLPFVKKAA